MKSQITKIHKIKMSHTNWNQLAHASARNLGDLNNLNLQEYEQLCSMRFKGIN